MVVNVTIAKLNGGRIRLSVRKPEYEPIATQEYDSEKEARELLLDMGIPEDALHFYFSKLFPCLEMNQELVFPETNLPEYELRWRGFQFADGLSQGGSMKASRKRKPAVTLPGTVEKIIPTPYPSEREKAEISVDGADALYREIRIENTLQDEEGKEVGLNPGAQVEVTIEAEPHETSPKQPSQSQSDTESERPAAEAGTTK